MADVPAFVPEALASLGVELSDDQLSLQAGYLRELLDANQRFNLTGIREVDAAWRRHIVDSLSVLPGLAELEADDAVVDVGTGGGLPGVPLAIARPDLRFTLVEATGKKAAFVRAVAARLGLTNVDVVDGRAEDVGRDRTHREAYDLAVCRAVGPMRELLEYTLPLVRVGGLLLAMKGPSVESELADAGDALEILGGGELEVIEAYPEGDEQRTVIVSVAKARPTPRDYPRRPGLARHEPL